MPLLTTRAGTFASTAVAVATAFNPAIGTTLAYSNGNRTVTCNDPVYGGEVAYSIAHFIVGSATKRYFEVSAGPILYGDGSFSSIGTGPSGAATVSCDFAGNVYISSGTPSYTNVLGGVVAAGDVIAMAADFGATSTNGHGWVWFRNVTTNTFWNNNSSADPTTGAGGFSMSLNGDCTSQDFCSAATCTLGAAYVPPDGQVVTGTFGPPFAGAVPTGYLGYGV